MSNTDHNTMLERLLAGYTALVEQTVQEVASSQQIAFLDPRDYGIGDQYGFAGYSTPGAPMVWMDRKKKGELIPVFLNEHQLTWIRRRIRLLCAANEIALAVIACHVRYGVGKGFKYRVSPRRDGVDPALVTQVQDLIDAFSEFNNLPAREIEAFTRVMIDGEAFLRLFPTDEGLLALRFVEPELIRSPAGQDNAEYSFGVQTLKYDVETVLGYWIVQGLPDEDPQPDFVPAGEIAHFKWHETPSTSKRGLSPFYPIETNLRLAEDLLTSTVALAKARAKIAMIRKLSGAISSVASSLVTNQAAVSQTDPQTNQTVNIERYGLGSIVTIPDTMSLEFPGANIAASDHTAVYQMVLRTIGARFLMPEYMISGDASSGTYSNTMVAESPFVKSMEGLQDTLGRLWAINRFGESQRAVMWRQVAYAARCGLLPRNVMQLVDIQAEGPSLVVRDQASQALVDKTYHEMGAKSLTTIQMEQGLDPDTEAANFENENAKRKRPDPGDGPGGDGPAGPAGTDRPGLQDPGSEEPEQPGLSTGSGDQGPASL